MRRTLHIATASNGNRLIVLDAATAKAHGLTYLRALTEAEQAEYVETGTVPQS